MVSTTGLTRPSSSVPRELPNSSGARISKQETEIKNISFAVFNTNQSALGKGHKYYSQRKENCTPSTVKNQRQRKEADERMKDLQPIIKSLKDKKCAPQRPANNMRKCDRDVFSQSHIENYKEMRLPSDPSKMKAHYYTEYEITQDKTLTDGAKTDQRKTLKLEYMIDRLKDKNISIDISKLNKNEAFLIIEDLYIDCFQDDDCQEIFPSFADVVKYT